MELGTWFLSSRGLLIKSIYVQKADRLREVRKKIEFSGSRDSTIRPVLLCLIIHSEGSEKDVCAYRWSRANYLPDAYNLSRAHKSCALALPVRAARKQSETTRMVNKRKKKKERKKEKRWPRKKGLAFSIFLNGNVIDYGEREKKPRERERERERENH